MDVLMGSIDVRDLLPSRNLDASSPLSAPDLRLLIDRLQIRSLSIKSNVRSYVLAHRHDFADIFARCAAGAEGVDDLAKSLEAALKMLSEGGENPLEVEIKGIVDEIRRTRRELAEKREALEIVTAVSDLHRRVVGVREDVRDGRFVEAAEAVRVLQEQLGSDSEAAEDEPVVFGLLRKEWGDCFDELQEALAKSFEKFVHFEPGMSRMTVRASACVCEGRGELELQKLYKAMEIVGVLDYGFARVADLVIKHIIVPTISTGSMDVCIDEVEQETDEKPVAVLSIMPASEFQEDSDGQRLYSRLSQIVRFIYEFICHKEASWMQCFGRLTWPRMSDRIISHFLSKAVPEDASKISDFQNVMIRAAEFEAFLKEIMFISKTDANDEKLSHFADNVEVHFASRKRNEILAKARNNLLQSNFDASPENISEVSFSASGTERSSQCVANLLFQPEKCVISKAVSKLMELVHQSLKDACLSSTRVAKEFYHAARDALLLYKAIIPIKLEKQMASISQVAIVVHNDCYFLSQEILGLSFEYRTHFPSGLQKHAVFVDIALCFSQMAEKVLQKQEQLILNDLMEAVDGADGFRNTHQSQQYQSAKFSIEQVVFILEKAHIMWEPLMPESIYRRTMCTLLNSVFTRVTGDMLLLDDMAAEETLQLQRLIQLVMENLSSLFASLMSDADERRSFLKNNTWVQLDKLIPSLCKFRKLADLYDMALKSITTLWECGELLSCGFTLFEVENFVRAIFSDSPLRKECLWKIQNASW